MSRKCRTCQAHAKNPSRYAAATQTGAPSSREVAMDIMAIRKKHALQAVGAGARCSAAKCFKSISVECVSKMLNETQIHLYAGAPCILEAAEGSQCSALLI